ncbi:MAG: hypothetical protein WCJ21_10225, partial [Planctomycetota bacterium]
MKKLPGRKKILGNNRAGVEAVWRENHPPAVSLNRRRNQRKLVARSGKNREKRGGSLLIAPLDSPL